MQFGVAAQETSLSRVGVWQYLKVETRSGKKAAFYVKDRVTLEAIREDMRDRVEKMRLKRQREKEAKSVTTASTSRGPVQQFFRTVNQLVPWPAAAAAQSEMVQRMLQQDGDTVEMQALKRKYAREIKQDTQIKALQDQIQDFKYKTQQQRVQKSQLQKEKTQLEREQAYLNEQTFRLKLALEEINNIHQDMDNSSVSGQDINSSAHKKKKHS